MSKRSIPDRQSDPQHLFPLKILSRDKIHQLIAHGHLIVIANTRVVKLDNWINRHPGGEKTILHMVGRDATDEINGYPALHGGCAYVVITLKRR